jgi:predicted nucleotidyltransferase
MTQQQINTIDKVISEAKKDTSVLGVILVGSLAKGTEKETSDVDVLIVVNDESFEKYVKDHQLYWTLPITDKSNYCEVDGKIINKDFLHKANNYGTESIKNTLQYSKVIYSEDYEIEKDLKTLKENIVLKKDYTKQFYALMKSKRYTADDDLDNFMQLKISILDTVLYACRLVLAHNNKLYPCMKNMVKEIETCNEKPKHFIEKMHKLLESLSLDDLEVFYKNVEEYYKCYVLDEQERKSYVIENEFFWYFDGKPYEYL